MTRARKTDNRPLVDFSCPKGTDSGKIKPPNPLISSHLPMTTALSILILLAALAVPAGANGDAEPSPWLSVPEPQWAGLLLWSALVIYLRRRTRGR